MANSSSGNNPSAFKKYAAKLEYSAMLQCSSRVKLQTAVIFVLLSANFGEVEILSKKNINLGPLTLKERLNAYNRSI